MTLILDFHVDILTMYLPINYETPRSRLSNLEPEQDRHKDTLQTHRQTDTTKRITTLQLRFIKIAK